MDIRPWDKPQLQNQTSKPMHTKPPLIAHGLTWLDLDCKANYRISAQVTNRTTTNFDAALNAWGDTVLYSAGMSYLELDPACFCIQTGTFSTNDIRSWQNPQAKNSKRINFAKPFTGGTPKIVCFVISFDYDHTKNIRLTATASDIDADGFTAHLDCWGDSVMYAAGMTWIAYPSSLPGIDSGSVNTQDVRPWDKPQHDNSGTAKFGKTFKGTPKVILGLNEIDYNCSKNLRWKCSPTNITQNQFTWNLQSWFDSIHYSSGVSWIAWE